jgi:hypothetical protein
LIYAIKPKYDVPLFAEVMLYKHSHVQVGEPVSARFKTLRQAAGIEGRTRDCLLLARGCPYNGGQMLEPLGGYHGEAIV